MKPPMRTASGVSLGIQIYLLTLPCLYYSTLRKCLSMIIGGVARSAGVVILQFLL